MIELTTPRGLAVGVPEYASEDPSPKFDLSDRDSVKRYYENNGYVIVKGLISRSDCDRVRALWEKEIKPSRQFIYRQATAKPERHILNSNGWVMNPILNPQSVDPGKYPSFRSFTTQHILTSPLLIKVFQDLLDEKPKIVQSMYFEGNSATWEHQDSYYLDSENMGAMAASWIALEDIVATAGRFFICPGSNKIALMHNFANNIVEHHEEYITSVVRKIQDLHLPIRAPIMNKGDVLFWNSWTIHGSLASHDAQHSRSSITCHAIPESHRLIQLQSRIARLNITKVNGVQVHRPKDLSVLKNRIILKVETSYPRIFYWVKSNAIKGMLRLRNSGAHDASHNI